MKFAIYENYGYETEGLVGIFESRATAEAAHIRANNALHEDELDRISYTIVGIYPNGDHTTEI